MTSKNPQNYDRFMDLISDLFQDRITEDQFDKKIKEIPNAEELAEMIVNLFRI